MWHILVHKHEPCCILLELSLSLLTAVTVLAGDPAVVPIPDQLHPGPTSDNAHFLVSTTRPLPRPVPTTTVTLLLLGVMAYHGMPLLPLKAPTMTPTEPLCLAEKHMGRSLWVSQTIRCTLTFHRYVRNLILHKIVIAKRF